MHHTNNQGGMKHTNWALLVAFILSVSLGHPALAETNEDALAAYKAGNFEQALKIWRPLAEQGDGAAQLRLSTMYAEGQGVPKDDAESLKWGRLAADNGIVAAQLIMGARYNEGRGVPKDAKEAVKWFEKAANKGAAYGQFYLGLMYAGGSGIPQDKVESFKWFTLAAAVFPIGSKQRDQAIYNANQVAAKMTPAEIAEAQRLAREWKPQ
jgi:TPR repeat protein